MSDVREILADYILGPGHVGFVVPDLEDAIAAASAVYGIDIADVRFEPPPDVEAVTRFAFFTVGGLEFEYIQPVSVEYREMLLGMPSGGAGINHIAWSVSDIEAAVSALALRGIVPGHVTPDGVITIGAKKMVYLDPATTGGLVIELIEYG